MAAANPDVQRPAQAEQPPLPGSTAAPMHQLLCFVLGAPGAGKGTQSELICKQFGWAHISAGDLLRAQVEAGTEAGRIANEYIKEGKMVPASMIIGLLRDALASSSQPGVLIDGFPRKADQLREFECTVRPCDMALFYSVAEETAKQRLLGRAETSGRVDDNEATIHKRFVVFSEESMPVVEALRAEGRVTQIDASSAPDLVFEATSAAIRQLEQARAAKLAASAAGEPPTQHDAGAAAAAAATAGSAAAVAAGSAAAGSEQPQAASVASPTAASASAAARLEPGLQMDVSSIRSPIVICGPSGVGKGTLIAKLMAQYPDRFGFSVSHTTRAPRPGEVHGQHYYFTDAPSMRPQLEAGMFLEHAAVHGNLYGTSLAAVARVSAEGKHCVLDIDVQGAQQVKASALGSRALFIFIAPPSHEELERRLRNRGTEAEDKVLQRLANAESEIAKAQEPGLFDHILVNGDLPAAYYQLRRLIEARVPGLLPELASTPRPSLSGGQVTTPAGAAAAAGVGPAAGGVPAAETNSSLGAEAAAALGGSTLIAAAAATGVAAASGPPSAGAPLANGSAAAAAGGAAAAAAGGTASLLDFGFGAAAGAAAGSKGLPVRAYMESAVLPVLREGLKALNVTRPDDPVAWLGQFLIAHGHTPAPAH